MKIVLLVEPSIEPLRKSIGPGEGKWGSLKIIKPYFNRNQGLGGDSHSQTLIKCPQDGASRGFLGPSRQRGVF